MQTNIFCTLSWPFSCDYNFWLRDLKFGMCIKDPINKTCWKNGKDLSNGAPKIKLWYHTKKTHFLVFAKNFRRPCMKLKNFCCQFPNPWTLRVSGMGGYTSKCEKSQNHCTLMLMFDWSALIIPQKATLDSLSTLLWSVSYRRLAPKCQQSTFSVVTRVIYLCELTNAHYPAL